MCVCVCVCNEAMRHRFTKKVRRCITRTYSLENAALPPHQHHQPSSPAYATHQSITTPPPPPELADKKNKKTKTKHQTIQTPKRKNDQLPQKNPPDTHALLTPKHPPYSPFNPHSLTHSTTRREVCKGGRQKKIKSLSEFGFSAMFQL